MTILIGLRVVGCTAPTFVEVQKEVAALIKGRILIGHAISNDTDVRSLAFTQAARN